MAVRLRSLPIRVSLAVLISISLLPFIVLIAYSGANERSRAFAVAQRESLRFVSIIASEQQSLVAGAEQLVMALSLLPELRNRNVAATDSLLVDLLKKNPQYTNIAVMDRSGLVWGTAVAFPGEISLGDRKYFQDAVRTGRFSSGEFTVGRISGKPIINFGYPVDDGSEHVVAVIGAAFDLEYIESRFANMNLPAGSSFSVHDRSGVPLYQGPTGGRSSAPQEEAQADAEVFHRMRNGAEEGVFEAPGSGGSMRLLAYRRISLPHESEPYLYVWSSIPRDSALSGATRAMVWDVAVLAAFFLVALLLLWFVGKRIIVDPIRALQGASERLAAGLDAVRVSTVVRGGELGELARVFDGMAEALVQREKAEQAARLALQESEGQFRDLAEKSLFGIFLVQDGLFRYANDRFADILGIGIGEVTDRPALGDVVVPEDQPRVEESFRRQMAGEVKSAQIAFRVCPKTGGTRHVQMYSSITMFRGGPAVIGSLLDITERMLAEEERGKLEAQMRHVQKLESLGVLAGGIAHDFNNLLTAVLGNADLVRLSLSPTSPARRQIEEIIRASQHGADLCRQMLAYSGKGRFVLGRYDLSGIVKEIADMLQVSISKKAALRFRFADDPAAVEADASQLSQVVMNLITNASDAIGDRSGVIEIGTGAMECDRAYLSESYLDERLEEGRYASLEVSDTGCGMDAETRRKIFDPFFTTKFTGRGLGLAAVLGIVRGHGGAIKVSSEPGRGTTIRILLPAVEWTPADRKPPEEHSAPFPGGGTILLIDDDPSVRAVASSMLGRMGFTVLAASDGQDGLEVFRREAAQIDCVLVDLTMPRLDGEEVFRELRRIRSDVKVILSSGYNEQEVTQRFVGQGLTGFIPKPYTYRRLWETLRSVFDGAAYRS